jgi:hypothetical protein
MAKVQGVHAVNGGYLFQGGSEMPEEIMVCPLSMVKEKRELCMGSLCQFWTTHWDKEKKGNIIEDCALKIYLTKER